MICKLCSLEFTRNSNSQKLCFDCRSINRKAWKRADYFKHRILSDSPRKHPIDVISCIECKKDFYRSNCKQKICLDCRKEYRRNHRLSYLKNRYKNDLEYRKKMREIGNKAKKSYVLRNPERHRNSVRLYSMKRRASGSVNLKTLQIVYEDNVKLYGTLTCILCIKPIEFGQDSLEHKVPICRGGTNDFQNLGISHIKCNVSKNRKTVEEYQRWIGVLNG